MKLNSGLQNMGKNFQASLDHLYGMLDFIREEAEEAGFSHSIVSKIELACEEALVNIIHYGYPDYRGNIEIACVRPSSKGIKIIIKDRGIPFNPLTIAKKLDPKTANPKEGYGVFFILKIMDEVRYNREDNCNVLTLIKFLS
jgi:anti-sigma regulatory factor (Ser/Thr protein kinase)